MTNIELSQKKRIDLYTIAFIKDHNLKHSRTHTLVYVNIVIFKTKHHCVQPGIAKINILSREKTWGAETLELIPKQGCFPKQTWCHRSAFPNCLPDVPIVSNKPKHGLVRLDRNYLCLFMENLKRTCSSHKTAMKTGESRSGKHYITRSPRVIYSSAANEHLAVVWPSEWLHKHWMHHGCSVLPHLHDSPHIINGKQTHFRRNEAGCKTALPGLRRSHSNTELLQPPDVEVLFLHCQTQLDFLQ